MLISDDGHALLTDFGTSHLAATSFSITREQHPGGTLDWMAPEYLDTDQLTMTTAGDIWAFGMTALVRKAATFQLMTLISIFAGVVYQKAPI